MIVILSTFTYLIYFSPPASFPSEKQLIEEINNTFPEAEVTDIQDVFDVGDRQRYVPFKSNETSYGKSFWVWDKYRWRVRYIDTVGEPQLWRINKNDPSSYHIVWNIHPDDQLKEIQFYLTRDRGYSIRENTKETYYPKVQMRQKISIEGEGYGVLKIPKDWVDFVNTINDTQAAKQSRFDALLTGISAEQQVFYGWIPYDGANKVAFPSNSVNGSGYSNGDIDLDFVMILNESEVDIQEND